VLKGKKSSQENGSGTLQEDNGDTLLYSGKAVAISTDEEVSVKAREAFQM